MRLASVQPGSLVQLTGTSEALLWSDPSTEKGDNVGRVLCDELGLVVAWAPEESPHVEDVMYYAMFGLKLGWISGRFIQLIRT